MRNSLSCLCTKTFTLKKCDFVSARDKIYTERDRADGEWTVLFTKDVWLK